MYMYMYMYKYTFDVFLSCKIISRREIFLFIYSLILKGEIKMKNIRMKEKQKENKGNIGFENK